MRVGEDGIGVVRERRITPTDALYSWGARWKWSIWKTAIFSEMTNPDARCVEAYNIKIIGPWRDILSILSLDKREVYQDFS